MAGARVKVQNALVQIRDVLDSGSFPVDSQEFKDLHQAYGKLSKAFGMQESRDLSMAGLKMAAGALSPKGMGAMGGGGGGGMAMAGPSPMVLGGM